MLKMSTSSGLHSPNIGFSLGMEEAMERASISLAEVLERQARDEKGVKPSLAPLRAPSETPVGSTSLACLSEWVQLGAERSELSVHALLLGNEHKAA